MTCVICGADLPLGAMFCGECGSAVVPRGVEQRAAAPAPPTPRASYVPPRVFTERATASGSTAVDEAVDGGEPTASVVVAQPVPAEDDSTEIDLPLPSSGDDLQSAPPAASSTPDPNGDSSSTRVVDLLENDEQWSPEAAPQAPWFPPLGTEGPVDEATRMPDRPKPAAVSFGLHFSTGESVTVQGAGLIGRRPSAQPGEYFDHYVTINDPGRSVSKTHLEFGQDGGAFWISDRYSANGTVVREPDRPARLCPAGMRSRVARGTRVEIGEQFFLIS